jgi:hypothetical protein
MAWLEKRGSSHRIKFRYAGKNHQVAALARLEDTLKLLARGRVDLPEGADLGLFLLSDARLGKKPEARRAWTLADLIAHPPGGRQGGEHPGGGADPLRPPPAGARGQLSLPQATAATPQEYVDKRGREAYRGRPINARTVRKELVTLQTVWNWAHRQGHLPTPCPARGLAYPKTADKPPFRTYDQVQAVVGRGAHREGGAGTVGRPVPGRRPGGGGGGARPHRLLVLLAAPVPRGLRLHGGAAERAPPGPGGGLRLRGEDRSRPREEAEQGPAHLPDGGHGARPRAGHACLLRGRSPPAGCTRSPRAPAGRSGPGPPRRRSGGRSGWGSGACYAGSMCSATHSPH